MAISIEKKFYNGSAFVDLSRIVYTSPNMNSPVNAGTRSHVLPGKGDIGTWYEDQSYMYRINDNQTETSTDYYNGVLKLSNDLQLDNDLKEFSAVVASGTYDDQFFANMKLRLGASATNLISYTGSIAVNVRQEYLPDGANIIYDINSLFTPGGITVPVLTGYTEFWLAFTFDNPILLKRVSFTGFHRTTPTPADYRYVGNYRIEGKSKLTDAWTVLYTGSNISNANSIAILNNNSYMKYYRLYILNNTSLPTSVTINTVNTTVNKNYYSICDLKFFVESYTESAVNDIIPVYNFFGNYDTTVSGISVSGVDYGANIIYVDDIINNGDGNFTFSVDHVTGSGIIPEDSNIYLWGVDNTINDFKVSSSVMFKVTNGEAYDCRLTAWDDQTHSTVLNPVLAGDHCRVSSVVYCCRGNSDLDPLYSNNPINYVFPPVHNRIFKGDVIYEGIKYYYGDFDIVYRYQTDINGDIILFKPMLYGITEDMPYGVHDFLIVLHYSYT